MGFVPAENTATTPAAAAGVTARALTTITRTITTTLAPRGRTGTG